MRLQIILSFIFLTTILSAQSDYQIKLTAHEPLILPNRAFHIESVIDNRKNPHSIGFVQKGIGNKRLNANFSSTFSGHLLRTFSQLAPKNKTTPVIAKVHNLYISERTTFSKEFGRAEVEIEFLTADSARSWGIFFADVEKKGIDVTKGHSSRIAKALSICLEQLVDKWKETPVAVVERVDNTFDPNQPIKEGLYASFSDFANQITVEGITCRVNHWSHQPNLVQIHNKANDKALKKYFAYSDGTNFYLSATAFSYEKHYVQAEFTGTYCYFEDRVSDTGASIAFGLIGALASNKKKGFVLDTQTGLVSELNRDFLARVLKDFPKLKKQYNNSKKKLADKKEVLRAFNAVLAKDK